MANTRSAKKRVRSSARRRVYNRPFRSACRTMIKAARTAVDEQAPEAGDAVQRAVRMLDKSAQKGVIHRNNAARRKSRLVRLLRASEKSTQA